MRLWTHVELHAFMDNDVNLKAKSDRVHALPQNSSAEKEQGKLQMMEIYAEAVNCKQTDAAKEFIQKYFSCVKTITDLDALREEYASQKLCHSPLGNNYMCFCDEKRSS